MRYVYSWIRFVPRPVVGECVNLGVVVGSDSPRDWKIHIFQSKDYETFRGGWIDFQGILPLVHACLEVLFSEMAMANMEERMLLAYQQEWHNQVQLSPLQILEVESAEAGVQHLLQLQTATHF